MNCASYERYDYERYDRLLSVTSDILKGVKFKITSFAFGKVIYKGKLKETGEIVSVVCAIDASKILVCEFKEKETFDSLKSKSAYFNSIKIGTTEML